MSDVLTSARLEFGRFMPRKLMERTDVLVLRLTEEMS